VIHRTEEAIPTDIDLVIRGGTVAGPERAEPQDLGIAGGRIACVAAPGHLPAARNEFDASGLHVLPGVIDTHVHLRDPGLLDREDFHTGTCAAAAGGITTIFEMPIALPPTHTADLLRERVATVQPKAVVDFAIYGGASAENLDEIEKMAEAGAIGFKTFRTAAPAGREEEFRGFTCPDDGAMLQVLQRVAATGRVEVIHAESEQVLAWYGREVRRGDPAAHALARPELAEVVSVACSLELARATGARLQIAHVSAVRALEILRAAKDAGQAVTVETCPHYLFLTDEDLVRHGPYAKINPPLRPRASQTALWAHLQAGDVDVIGTDHAPYLVSEKEPYWNRIGGAAAGAPGLEAMVPMLLGAVRDGRLGLPQMVRLTSENAARIFGLYPRKGRIAPGSDADLTICDLRVPGAIRTEAWLTKSRGTARIWDGQITGGEVAATLVRGTVVYERGRGVVAPAGHGQFVRP